jgi:hypothetical protein
LEDIPSEVIEHIIKKAWTAFFYSVGRGIPWLFECCLLYIGIIKAMNRRALFHEGTRQYFSAETLIGIVYGSYARDIFLPDGTLLDQPVEWDERFSQIINGQVVTLSISKLSRTGFKYLYSIEYNGERLCHVWFKRVTDAGDVLFELFCNYLKGLPIQSERAHDYLKLGLNGKDQHSFFHWLLMRTKYSIRVN